MAMLQCAKEAKGGPGGSFLHSDVLPFSNLDSSRHSRAGRLSRQMFKTVVRFFGCSKRTVLQEQQAVQSTQSKTPLLWKAGVFCTQSGFAVETALSVRPAGQLARRIGGQSHWHLGQALAIVCFLGSCGHCPLVGCRDVKAHWLAH